MKEKYPDKVELNLPIWKKIIFSLVVLTVVFLALELGLRLLLKPESRFLADPYVSFSGSAPLFIEAKDPGTGSAIMKTAPYKLNLPRFCGHEQRSLREIIRHAKNPQNL